VVGAGDGPVYVTNELRRFNMLLSTQAAPANDKQRFLVASERAMNSWATYAPHLKFFRRRMRQSKAVAPEEVPGDVITMNSRFALRDDRTDQTICYTLVYPEHEAPHFGRVSVLAPMGMALYGARVGDEVVWMSATGPEVATVERLIYQPEAAGHHNR
jgi:regulator of nucleoside diphosphate kinase